VRGHQLAETPRAICPPLKNKLYAATMMNNNKCKPLDKKKKQEKEAAKMLEPHKVEAIEQRPEV